MRLAMEETFTKERIRLVLVPWKDSNTKFKILKQFVVGMGKENLTGEKKANICQQTGVQCVPK